MYLKRLSFIGPKNVYLLSTLNKRQVDTRTGFDRRFQNRLILPERGILVPDALKNSSNTLSDSEETMQKKMILYDVPVSNNGARIRCLLYKKKLLDFVEIKPPVELGGLSSDAYKKLNPFGKMPVLELEDGSGLPESQVIESYILDKFSDFGPSLIPGTPESRALAALIVRIHDLYMTTIQGCMYKPMDSKSQRATEIAQIGKQLDIIEAYCQGPYMCGSDMSYADTAILPTIVFCNYILPKFFGWPGIFEDRSKLQAWWKLMGSDPDIGIVIQEVEGGLESWNKSKRWEEKGILKDVADSSYCWYPN